MQYIALKNVHLAGVDYVLGDIIPGTAINEDRFPFLMRRGLIAADSETLAGVTPPAGDNDSSLATTAWAAERAVIGNLLTGAEAACSGGWIGTGAITYNGDGTLTTPDTTYLFSQSNPVAAPGQTYTATVEINKAVGAGGLTLFFESSPGTAVSTVQSPAALPLGDGWYRLTVTAVAPATTQYLQAYVYASGSSFSIRKATTHVGAGGDWTMPGVPIPNQGVRVSRPNIDDRLVEVWNGAAWSVVDYQSGVRDIGALMGAGIASIFEARLARVGNTCHVSLITVTVGGSPLADASILDLPDRFRPNMIWLGNGGGVTAASCYALPGGPILGTFAAGATFSLIFTFPCQTDIPTTLPGILVSAAPS